MPVRLATELAARETMEMNLSYRYFAAVALAAIAVPACLIGTSKASDHADTPEIAASPGADLTDVYAFPSPRDPNKVVLAMNVHPLIGPGQAGGVTFDPNVLYQFKIDTTGDAVEDLVVQAKFTGNGRNQHAFIIGPVRPSTIGANNVVEHPAGFAQGQINTIFTGPGGIKVFAGGREDSFFFDLEQFFNILPDRAYPLTDIQVPDPNNPHAGSWRPQGQAVDFLSNGGFNVLSIVVELPKSLLRGRTNARQISLWCTTNVRHGDRFSQMDRLARPAVNEVFATAGNGRHKVNDLTQPSEDHLELANDIQGFMTFPAGRSQAIIDVVKAVLVPDMIKIDLDGEGAAYLGVETGGATGGTFGGRALTDDVIDTSLGVIFGNTIPALGLAPDDNNEIPTLTSDHVGPEGKHFTSTFPYLGAPR
jgi:hypothetical protein